MGEESNTGFSIRGYVNKMREVDPYQCWPFPVGDLTREQILSQLPPLTLPKRTNIKLSEEDERLLRNLELRKRNLKQEVEEEPQQLPLVQPKLETKPEMEENEVPPPPFAVVKIEAAASDEDDEKDDESASEQ